jgi:nucleoside-diphosphate-sugar epimerase/glycosyltransferase involved in cell wall biosynthesis
MPPAADDAADISSSIRKLQGPILVLGASGFVGANLLHTLLAARQDVFGTATRTPAWRLDGLPPAQLRIADLLVESNLDALLSDVRPRTVFDCIAYGAYSFETDSALIYRTNFTFLTRLLEKLARAEVACYLHAGSSSEYGDRADGPAEDDPAAPNSDYAVSKLAAAALINFYGKRKRFPCANLRLYSVYGPMEDSSRLIPNMICHGVDNKYPPLVDPEISRDFIYVDDATEAFVATALSLGEQDYGESFNIGTGKKTTIAQAAETARDLMGISEAPKFSMPPRQWDVPDWYANPEKANKRLGWRARTSFRDGLARTIAWFKSLPDREAYQRSSKRFALDTHHSVSAIVACHNDAPRIPQIYERLQGAFSRLQVDYEIIFVNDGSTDESEEAIRALSRNDRRVLGISHSRPFGSQAALRGGMEIAGKNCCVLMDGSLADPPELIEQFVARWKEGFDVVYGRRRNSEGSLPLRMSQWLFYRLFNAFSYLPIPRDAGDFSLLDKRVVAALLQFPERDLFIRGVRAFAGFRQVGVDYSRARGPRRGGRDTLMRRFMRAKQGVLSFSNVPLSILSFFGVALMLVSIVLGMVQIIIRLVDPHRSVSGITTLLLAIFFFGAVNAFALGLVGEYIGRIFEEVKQRPHFIRRTFIKDGEIRPAAESAPRSQP